MQEPLLMKLENSVYLQDNKLVIVDRRVLPTTITKIVCNDSDEVAQAIKDMVVQGSGDIAITAGFGLYLSACACKDKPRWQQMAEMEFATKKLISTRPTGYHLTALLNKIITLLKKQDDSKSCSYSHELVANSDIPYHQIIFNYLQEVLKKQNELSQKTGKNAESLLNDGDTILTHCFAGAGLLYMLRYATQNKKKICVFCSETRPYLQGARLTAWSVSEMGIDTTLISDNMSAHCMAIGKINKIFTAADRVAMDGTVANKVGTLQIAILAHHFNIPFYVLAYGGADKKTISGEQIPIEERNPREVLCFNGNKITGEKVKAFYPAFDITHKNFISAYITAKGILYQQDFNL
ncbi:MAG: s-methyl-5-thioribose-1-phosphate isomerase [Deltaproteobacteria bacterium]